MNPLAPLLRRSLYAIGGVLVFTGAAWAVMRYLPALARLEERDARAWCAALMKVHGAAAMLALLLLGSLLSRHIARGWRLARNRASGGMILALAATLVATGYLLYYAGGEATRRLASWLHLAAGIALPLPVAWHALRILRPRFTR